MEDANGKSNPSEALPATAPSEIRPPIPWVTVSLITLSAGITILATNFPEEIYRAFYADSLEVWRGEKWWALLTSLFVHGSFFHLLFNSGWVWFLGVPIERELRPLHYLGLVITTTWLASVAELGGSGQIGVGMSGTVYGLFGYMLVNRSHNPAYRKLLGMQVITLMIGWLVLCFVLTHAGTMQVANFAHLGGLVAGVVTGYLGRRDQSRQLARAAGIAGVVVGVGSLVPLVWAPWLDEWHVVPAYRALEKRDYAQALESLGRVRRAFPDYAWAAINEANIRDQRGEHALALDILSEAAKHTRDAELANNLAWLLATCPDAGIRDGVQAVRYARQACEDTHWTSADVLDTLAAAYAETGEFTEAVKWSAKAVELSELSGNRDAELQMHHEHFRTGKPWREIPVGSKPVAPASL